MQSVCTPWESSGLMQAEIRMKVLWWGCHFLNFFVTLDGGWTASCSVVCRLSIFLSLWEHDIYFIPTSFHSVFRFSVINTLCVSQVPPQNAFILSIIMDPLLLSFYWKYNWFCIVRWDQRYRTNMLRSSAFESYVDLSLSK